MNELPVWWLAVEAVGVAAFPLTFVFFHRLPDRGFAFSKIVGLVLLGYTLWMGAVLGLLPNNRGAVILVLVAVAVASLFVVAPQRRAIASYLRGGWRYILFVEAMFALVLVASVYLRSFAPQIDSGEKPFEFAFLNAINRTESFPPPDPWLSGHSISYYYFGYVIVSALTKLTALQTSVTFFLGLSLTAALAWTAAFGVVYNLVAASRRDPPEVPSLWPRAALFGIIAALLLLVVSNLEGVFELMARHGVGSQRFYDALGVYGLPDQYDCARVPADCARWYPTRFYWWWWATRIGSSYDIQEFPFFSFHFGDLHAHVMAMPLIITLAAVAYQRLAGPEPPGVWWALRRPRRFLFVALVAGAVAFTDAWTIPLTVLLLVACTGLAQWLHGGRRLPSAAATALTTAVPLLATMVLLYLPFYWHLEGDARGIAVAKTAFTSGAVPQASEATRPGHLLIFWGPLLWVTMSASAVALYHRRRSLPASPRWTLAALVWAVPLLLWATLVAVAEGPDGLVQELRARGPNLLTIALLAAAITVAGLWLLQSMNREDAIAPDHFAPVLILFALVMLLGAELFFVKDALGFRANTVFRFWHEAWTLLAIAGAFGLFRLTARWRPPGIAWRYLSAWGLTLGAAYTLLVVLDPWHTLYSRWWTATPGLFVAGGFALTFAAASAAGPRRCRAALRLAWVLLTALVLTAALTYPVLVIFDRTGGFTYAQTMDGLDFLRRQNPDEYDAIRWLNQNVRATPVIAEAIGDDFSGSARISSRTGLPTVIGWVNHEAQWRGRPGPTDNGQLALTVRPIDVFRLYSTSDQAEAETIIRRYGIQYVYVGALERETYGTEGPAKFGQFMDTVFSNASVTIYRVREQGQVLPTR